MISGALASRSRSRRRRQFAVVRPHAAHMPDARGEELLGIVERLRLHVLAQRQRHRPALRRIGQHRQRARQCGEDLLRPRDAIEVARHRAEAVVRRYRAVAEALHLLQHRIGPARGEHVAWQQQHRQPIDMRDRRGGDHVGGARSDRGGAGHHAPPVHRLGVADRRQRHRLLVVRAIGRQVARDAPPAPRRCRRHCRGRRSPIRRRTAAPCGRRIRCAAPPDSAPAPAPWSVGSWPFLPPANRRSRCYCPTLRSGKGRAPRC